MVPEKKDTQKDSGWHTDRQKSRDVIEQAPFGLVPGKLVVALFIDRNLNLAPVPAVLRPSELTLTHAKEHELEKSGAVEISN